MEIRQFHPSDADALAQPIGHLLNQLRAGASLDADRLRSILSDSGVYVFGAYLDGSLAGILTLTRSHLLSGIRSRIEDVIVDEAHRRRGLAAMLVKHALRVSNELEAVTVDLTSAPSRIAATAGYHQLGFVLRETNVYRYSLRSMSLSGDPSTSSG
jgi:ribosomal protein S18 acetylase RimI-like enzyme